MWTYGLVPVFERCNECRYSEYRKSNRTPSLSYYACLCTSEKSGIWIKDVNDESTAVKVPVWCKLGLVNRE